MKIKVISILTTEIDYGPYQSTWQVDPVDAALHEILVSLNLGFNTQNPSGEVTPFRAKITASRILTEEDYEAFREQELTKEQQNYVKSPINKTVTVHDEGILSNRTPETQQQS